MIEVTEMDWHAIHESLNKKGYVSIKQFLSPQECQQLQALYSIDDIYRNTINMQRYRFGSGEYRYFNYPLPPLIENIRSSFYTPLSVIANDWMQKLSTGIAFPRSHNEFIERCRKQNQTRPTPLILRYETGGHNTLHQDLYGTIYFPFQLVIVLTQKEVDHTGGELVFTEQIPRAQSKAEVLQPNQGDAVIFTTHFRPVNGTRGYYRANMKHGVSEITSGRRFALGVIFHDAE